MKHSIILLTALPILVILSCSKTDKPVEQSKTQMLTTGTWKITAIMSDNDGNGSYESDSYQLFPACTKDNFYTFKTGGALDMDEASIKCDPTDPQVNTTPWQLTNNDTRISLDGDEYIIEVLNATTLRFKDGAPTSGSLYTMTKR